MRLRLISLVLLAACSKDKDPEQLQNVEIVTDSSIDLADDVSPAADATAADIAAAATAD